MDANELRTLADALRPMAKAPCFDGIDIERAADYLRAQADAQPVAWRTFDGEGNYNYRDYELNEDYADEWNRRNPNHVGWVEPLYTHPAPAVPKVAASFYTEDAELIGTTSAPIKKVKVEDDGSIHVFIDHWPQAEPKREPLSDKVVISKARISIVRIQPDDWVATDADLIDFARAIERFHGIGGSDER